VSVISTAVISSRVFDPRFSVGLGGGVVEGTSVDSLSLGDDCVLSLLCSANTEPSWIFRWQDAGGSDWMTVLMNLKSDGSISISSMYSYTIYDRNGYTYIGAESASGAVPEHAPLLSGWCLAASVLSPAGHGEKEHV
jgi:hypothetical protein